MEETEALSKIGIGSTVIVVGVALGVGFHYVFRTVLARSLGPDSYGVFVQGLGVVQTASFISLLGLHMSAPRFMSYYQGADEENLVGKTFSTAFYILLPSAIIATGVIFFFSEWISLSIFNEPALVEPLRLFSFGVIPFVLVHLVMALFRGMQNAEYKIYIDDLAWSGGTLLFVLVFLFLDYGVEGAVYAYVLSTAFAVILGYYFYRKFFDRSIFSSSGLITRRLILFSWPLFISSVLLMTNRWMDVLMLGWLSESSQAGIYDVSYAIAGMLAFLIGSLNYMFMPVASELYGEGKISQILEIYSTATRWITITVMPLLAGILIFSEQIIALLFGSSYVSGALPLMILSIGFAYRAMKGPAGGILLSIGEINLRVIGIACATTVVILLNFILIPKYGMLGAAVATTSGFIIGDTVLLLMAREKLGGLPYNHKYLQILPATFLASAPIYALKTFFNPSPVLCVFLGAILVLVYLTVLYLSGGFYSEDKKMFWDIVSASLEYLRPKAKVVSNLWN